MYDWFYKQLKKKYGENCTLLYTDTDSLLVNIKTEDAYKDMAEMKDDYDFSEYSKEHSLHDEINKKVIVKMKDECNGTPIANTFVCVQVYNIQFCEPMNNLQRKQKE